MLSMKDTQLDKKQLIERQLVQKNQIDYHVQLRFNCQSNYLQENKDFSYHN